MNKRGFTLIETLVAIAVLAIALAGPFVAAQNALKGSQNARDQLIASSLAQEGLEYIRSVRDNNYLATPRQDWMAGLSDKSCYDSTNNYCTVDPTESSVNNAIREYTSIGEGSCTTGVECLYLSPTGFYNQQEVGTQTSFERAVQFDEISESEVKVTVRVFWTVRGNTFSVVVTDILRDWL